MITAIQDSCGDYAIEEDGEVISWVEKWSDGEITVENHDDGPGLHARHVPALIEALQGISRGEEPRNEILFRHFEPPSRGFVDLDDLFKGEHHPSEVNPYTPSDPHPGPKIEFSGFRCD